MRDVCTESRGKLKDVGNFRAANYEVSAATKCLSVDLSGYVIDGFDQSLIPFADSTGEVRGSRSSTKFSTSFLVHEQAGRSTPVVGSSRCSTHKITKNLSIDLKSNLLRKDRSQLNLCIKVVVCVEILSQLRTPLSLELLGLSGDAHRVNSDLDLWNGFLIFKPPAILSGDCSQCSTCTSGNIGSTKCICVAVSKSNCRVINICSVLGSTSNVKKNVILRRAREVSQTTNLRNITCVTSVVASSKQAMSSCARVNYGNVA